MPPKKERLAKRKDIQLVVAQPQLKFHSPLFNLIARENGRENSRLAIAVSKKVGKAVVRNKLRRRYRAIFRRRRLEIITPLDILLYPKTGSIQMSSTNLEGWLVKGLGIVR